MLPINQIITADALSALKEMPDESINCCISSPPYWSLRAYSTEPQIWGGNKGCEHRWSNFLPPKPGGAGNKEPSGFQQKSQAGQAGALAQMKQSNSNTGQFCSLCGAWRGELGLEPTIELYIDHLCTIYDEVARILRKDGTCWVNIADTYWGGKGQSGQGSPEYQAARQDASINKPASHTGGQKLTRPQDMQHDTIQAKSLCLIPQRFAIEMVNRGWICRNVITWSKPNPMPSSAKDRFTVDFEYVYFFVKSKRYFFEPQYEPYKSPEGATDSSICGLREVPPGQSQHGSLGKPRSTFYSPLGRNKRTTWTIPTEAFSAAHFATFPQKLVEPMIRAGCPRYVCSKCGTPRRKVYERDQIERDKVYSGSKHKDQPKNYSHKRLQMMVKAGREAGLDHNNPMKPPKYKGYSDCGCENPEYKPGIALDPFAGSCTTAVVAHEHGRDYVMVELSPEYVKIGTKRINKQTERYSLLEK